MQFFYAILIVNELVPNQFQNCFCPRGTRAGERGKKEVGRRCDARQSVKRRKQWIIH